MHRDNQQKHPFIYVLLKGFFFDLTGKAKKDKTKLSSLWRFSAVSPL